MDSERVNQLEDQRHQQVMTAISGVHDRLDLLNGRTRTLENRVGILQAAYGLGVAVIGFLVYKVTGHQP